MFSWNTSALSYLFKFNYTPALSISIESEYKNMIILECLVLFFYIGIEKKSLRD